LPDDGFTTLLSPALNDALPPDVPPLEVEPFELVPLLEHAARVTPAVTAHAATRRFLRFLICGTSPFIKVSGLANPRIKRVLQPVTE
jgi:hypothetical protein